MNMHFILPGKAHVNQTDVVPPQFPEHLCYSF